jgi:hypothetical protein
VIWDFLWFDLCFFDAIVFVIVILVFHKHWYTQWWPWLMICKFGLTPIDVWFAIFLFLFHLISLGKI